MKRGENYGETMKNYEIYIYCESSRQAFSQCAVSRYFCIPICI